MNTQDEEKLEAYRIGAKIERLNRQIEKEKLSIISTLNSNFFEMAIRKIESIQAMVVEIQQLRALKT